MNGQLGLRSTPYSWIIFLFRLPHFILRGWPRPDYLQSTNHHQGIGASTYSNCSFTKRSWSRKCHWPGSAQIACNTCSQTYLAVGSPNSTVVNDESCVVFLYGGVEPSYQITRSSHPPSPWAGQGIKPGTESGMESGIRNGNVTIFTFNRSYCS